MSSLLDNLNPHQRQAVQYTEGPLLILAGAGSGKTRTITYRIWYLITHKGVSPWNILAVTFTNKAAEEMKNRLKSLLSYHSENLNVWVSTFHSACVRILRQHIGRLGISNDFAIMDAQDQLRIIKKCIAEVDDYPQSLPPYVALAEIRRAKNDLISSRQYTELAEGDFFRSRLAKIFKAYEQTLAKDQALDFDDLLLFTERLFRECPDVLALYQRRCQYIMVDEYQDTNHAQSRIITLLAEQHRNICVVGDDDQSIYRWRGADIHNILDFEKLFPETKIIRLEQNYRSTKNILKAATRMIAHNSLRKSKELWTANEEGAKITLYEAQDEYAEARYISRKIQELWRSDFPDYRSFAVLYRTNAQSRTIEEALRNDGLPYQIVGGLKFYERKEIKDLIAYLKVISNPDSRVNLLRIINVPPRKIGQSSLGKIEALADERQISFSQAMAAILDTEELNRTQKQNLGHFLKLLDRWRDFRTSHPLWQLLELVLKDTDYLAYLLEEEKTDQAESRVENVKELLSAIRSFEQKNPNSSLEDFLDYVSLLSDVDEYHEVSAAVTLMTLHSAKGLEFPVVFMTGMEEGLFPLSRSTMSCEELEEERRLCYVGMTRAEKRLFLTRAEQRMVYGCAQYSRPSRFIAEIPQEYLALEIDDLDKEKEDAQERSFVYGKPRASATKLRINFPDSQNMAEESEDFQPGERVYHQQWGEGIIFSREGEGENSKVFVNFGGLKKKLLVKYARLRKI
ncbi:MAG: UvrD-helicase domain-containing protein [bacterium]|nr:UvrD-helicase domain-containing protein [bacterium]